MPRAPSGELIETTAGYSCRLRAGGERIVLSLFGTNEHTARERMRTLALVARDLGAAATGADGLLREAAATPTDEGFGVRVEALRRLAGGKASRVPMAGKTVADFSDDWTKGRLAKAYPDHVKDKASIDGDAQRLRDYVLPVIGALRVADVTLDDCDRVLAKMPGHLASATRRQVAQSLRRLLALAVYPAKLRPVHPIPKGWLPRVVSSKAKAALWPSEERALLACVAVPLVRRMVWGVLAREGLRVSELASLRWRDVDLATGRVRLDANKTDDARAWALDPGVKDALTIWREHYATDKDPDAYLFGTDGIPFSSNHLAVALRADLTLAGVKRPELTERSARRLPIRAHDLRAVFVTCALANGKTETWVADRTGHKSSIMINRYRRAARTWEETGLGTLAPMVETVPELAAFAHGIAHRTGKKQGKKG